MNIVILEGRLVDDLQVQSISQDFKTCKFTIAVRRNFKNRNGEYDTDFIQCQVNNKACDFLTQYFHKGDPITLEGSWRVAVTDKPDGTKNWWNTCVVSSIHFPLTQKPKDTNQTDPGYNQNYSQNYNQPVQNYNQGYTQPIQQGYTKPVQPEPVYQEPKTKVIPGKMSSWQQPITQNMEPVPKDINENSNIIPQAFDPDIDLTDEFLPPQDDGFIF